MIKFYTFCKFTDLYLINCIHPSWRVKTLRNSYFFFLQVLDNSDVVTKIAKVLSISIDLIFDKNLNSILYKLDKLIKDRKALNNKLDQS